jgi:5-methylcytosine-specific restriction endonuclease McrA
MNTVVAFQPQGASDRRAYKNDWQRKQRAQFQKEHGFSTAAVYATGGNRAAVLERDDYCCARCGMTDAEHKAKWNRPITIDHKSKDRSDNSMGNLQTLCLPCHGNKDLIPRLRVRKVDRHKGTIERMRADGATFAEISTVVGLSRGTICTAMKKWGAS